MEALAHGRGSRVGTGKTTPVPRKTCSNAPHHGDPRGGSFEAVDKKRARLNCINHLLGQIPYGTVEHPEVSLPDRVRNDDYLRHPVPEDMYVPDVYRGIEG
jgi:hypothetical protein